MIFFVTDYSHDLKGEEDWSEIGKLTENWSGRDMEAIARDLEIYHRMRLDKCTNWKKLASQQNGIQNLMMCSEADADFCSSFEKLLSNSNVRRIFFKKEIIQSVKNRKSTVDQEDLSECRMFSKQSY